MTTEQRNAARSAVLELLTREVTAFASWGEFRDAMRAGYVPTIRARAAARRASAETRWKIACETELRNMVREEGFLVFDGRTVS